MPNAFDSQLGAHDSIPTISPPRRVEITEQDLADPVMTPQPPFAGAIASTSALAPAYPGLPAVKAPSPAVGATYCRACGGQLDHRAALCPRCGVTTESHAMAQSASMVNLAVNSKSSGVAILLSLFWPGAGQWYCGHIGRGFAFWGAAVVSFFLLFFLIGIVLLPLVVIWSAIDANKLVDDHNRRLVTGVTGVV